MKLKTYEHTFFKFNYSEKRKIFDDFKETNYLSISFERDDYEIIDIYFRLIGDEEITESRLMEYHKFTLLPTLNKKPIINEMNKVGNLKGQGIQFNGEQNINSNKANLTGFTFVTKLKAPIDGITQIVIFGYYGTGINNKPALNESEKEELEAFFDSIEILQ